MEEKKFIKKKEDFICANCSTKVKGNGYTNHCPSCLYSKHVDINPGDRKSDCQGMMKPVSISYKRDTFIIHHLCLKCGMKKSNKATKEDNVSQFLI